MLQDIFIACYVLLLLGYLVSAWAMGKYYSHTLAQHLRNKIMRYNPRFRHLVGIWLTLAAGFWFFAHLGWFAVSMLTIVEGLMWLFLFLYVLPSLRAHHWYDAQQARDISVARERWVRSKMHSRM